MYKRLQVYSSLLTTLWVLGAFDGAIASAAQQAPYVIMISVDGMGSEYVKPLLASGLTNELTTFKRFQSEGSGTLNARDDADFALTLPNHVTMMTSRSVNGQAGHHWVSNSIPSLTDTLAGNKGSYVASGFDVAHDHGLRTGLWAGKTKFNLFQQSYSATSGAPDVIEPDHGQGKIDYNSVVEKITAPALTADFTNRMTATPFNFVFIHYQDPDTSGHNFGWSTNPSSPFAASLKLVDTQISKILSLAENNAALQDKVTIILTADHGGHTNTHGDVTNPLDYTIPFYVWGAGVTSGGDLYAMNPDSRTAPGATSNPPYTGAQPIRNGEAANLALDLLGLGAIPGSTINSSQNLWVAAAPVITGFTFSGAGTFTINGNTDAAGDLVTKRMTNLVANPAAEVPIQTNRVSAGSFSLTIPQDTHSQSFFRLIRQ